MLLTGAGSGSPGKKWFHKIVLNFAASALAASISEKSSSIDAFAPSPFSGFFAAIPGKPMRLLVQGVGQRFDRHFDRAWQADEQRISRLVVIGQQLDRAAIEAELKAALA